MPRPKSAVDVTAYQICQTFKREYDRFRCKYKLDHPNASKKQLHDAYIRRKEDHCASIKNVYLRFRCAFYRSNPHGTKQQLHDAYYRYKEINLRDYEDVEGEPKIYNLADLFEEDLQSLPTLAKTDAEIVNTLVSGELGLYPTFAQVKQLLLEAIDLERQERKRDLEILANNHQNDFNKVYNSIVDIESSLSGLQNDVGYSFERIENTLSGLQNDVGNSFGRVDNALKDIEENEESTSENIDSLNEKIKKVRQLLYA